MRPLTIAAIVGLILLLSPSSDDEGPQRCGDASTALL